MRWRYLGQRSLTWQEIAGKNDSSVVVTLASSESSHQSQLTLIWNQCCCSVDDCKYAANSVLHWRGPDELLQTSPRTKTVPQRGRGEKHSRHTQTFSNSGLLLLRTEGPDGKQSSTPPSKMDDISVDLLSPLTLARITCKIDEVHLACQYRIRMNVPSNDATKQVRMQQA